MIVDNIIHNFKDGSPNYPVIDIYESENRAEAVKEEYTIDNIINYDLRTLDNRIGQVTNISTYYANKGYNDLREYDRELVIARLLQGEEIDFVKHGIRSLVQPDDFKDARKVKPYFLQKYKYGKEHNIQRYIENAPLNQLCYHIEEFEEELFANDKFKTINTMDLLINKNVLEQDKEETLRVQRELKEIYADFKKESSKIHFKIRDKTEDQISDIYETFYDTYFYKVNELSDNKELLSSLAVHLNYTDSNDSRVFPWTVAWQGLTMTIEKTAPATIEAPRLLTQKDKQNLSSLDLKNTNEFLGNTYSITEIPNKLSAMDFIEKEYGRKIEKDLKKQLHSFELETSLQGFRNRTTEEVSEIIENKELHLGSEEFNGRQYASLFLDNEYVASISAKDESFIDDEIGFIDLKSMRNKVEVEIVKKHKSSMKIRLKLVG